MAFTEDQLEQVRARADIVEIIGSSVRLRRAGRNLVGLCPFHQEKTPSFSVNPERGFFHCFGCGAGGTVFNFLMRVEGMSFPDAVRSLATRYGIKLPERESGGVPSNERESMLNAAEVAASFFSHVLWKTPYGAPAREYLHKRGISVETAEAYALGFAPALPAALAKNLDKRDLRAAGLKIGVTKQRGPDLLDAFRGRLMFPIRDGQGRTIAFGGRVLDSSLPKYINSPESPLYSKSRSVYGIFEARRAIAKNDRVIVVEGNIDAIALWQAGFQETVASLGTALTVDQLRLVGRITRNVMACFDGDNAGRKASLRALAIFLEAGLLGRAIFVPAGFDPDSFIKERGAAAFGELINESELLVDFFIKEQAARARGSLTAQARAAEEVANTLKLVTNPFEFDLLARKSADALGVAEEVLRRHARPAPANRSSIRPTPAAKPLSSPRADARSEAEMTLLAAALAFPELRAEILQAEIFAGFKNQQLSETLGDVTSEDRSGEEMNALVARLPEAEQSRLSALMISPSMGDVESARQICKDCIKLVQREIWKIEMESRLRIAKDHPDEHTAQAALAATREMSKIR